MGLGQLERRVMDVLWESPDRARTGRAIADELPDRAYTTVLTILERLRRKELVTRSDEDKVHTFRAVASRESYTVALMLEDLGSAPDPHAVLVRFAETVSPDEARVLRRALDTAPKQTR